MNKIYSILAVALVGISFTSCGLYQKYQRPKMVTDSVNVMRDAANYARSSSAGSAFSAENTTDTTSFGDVAWREVFTDPQLQKLIQQGLDSNVDLYSAAQNVKKLEAALSCARLAFLPSISLSPSGTLSKIVTGDSKSDWNKSYAFPITASWSVDIFGNILSQKRAAEMNLAMSKDAEQAVRSQIICGIATTYYTLLMLDRQKEILADMEKLTYDTWNMMKLQKELRGAKETAVVSAEASYLEVKAQQVGNQRQITETENALSLLLEQPCQAVSRNKLADQSLPAQFATGIPVRTLANRPDVHAKEMSLASKFYAIETARSKFYPSITLSATGSWTNSLGTAIMNPGQFLANFVGSLTQPIFQNGRLTAALKVAKIEYDVAEKEWQHSLLNAGAEVSNALVEYNSSNAESELDKKQVAALTKSVQYTSELFKMGSSTYLEVIAAQSSLLNAEITQLTDDYNKMAAVVSLYSALGGGRN